MGVGDDNGLLKVESRVFVTRSVYVYWDGIN